MRALSFRCSLYYNNLLCFAMRVSKYKSRENQSKMKR